MAYVKGIAHTAFKVHHMEASVRFYEEALGFTKAFELRNPRDGSPWIVYLHAGGDQFIELFYGGENKAAAVEAPIGFEHMCLAVQQIRELAASLEAMGVLDSPVSRGSDGNYQCWTHDPDGNRIELMQMEKDSLQSRFLKNRNA